MIHEYKKVCKEDMVVLTQGSFWHVLPKGLPQAASLSNLHHSGNIPPCLQSL